MGAAGAALMAIMEAKQAYDAARGPDPGLAPVDTSIPQAAPVPNYGQQGLAMAQVDPVQAPDMSAPAPMDTQMPDMSQTADMQAPTVASTLDNAYTAADDTSTKDIANSIGTPSDPPVGAAPATPQTASPAPAPSASSDPPITVTGDSWSPKKESTLGKIGDAFLMLKGHAPIFRQRTDEANVESAMQGLSKDPEQVISRVAKINPELAWKMYSNMSEIKANQELANQRSLETQGKGNEHLSSIAQAILTSKAPDKDALWQKALPMMQQTAQQYELNPEKIPQSYDEDAIKLMAASGIPAAEQQRISQTATRDLQNQSNEKARIGLDKLGKEISINNYKESVRHDQSTEQAMGESRVLTARAEALKQGVTLDSSFAPYVGMKPGQYVVSPDKAKILMMGPDGYVSGYKIEKGSDGHSFIYKDQPLIRGTTMKTFLSQGQ